MKNIRVLIPAALLSACNLGIDVDDYPYQQVVVIPDAGNNNPMPDTGNDMSVEPDAPSDTDLPDMMDMPDVGPMGSAELMITEILINTSEMNALGNGEVGEFVEVKNVGDGPADPRRISFQIASDTGGPQTISVAQPTTPEQLEVYTGLQPIEPGEYFVFVRFQADGLPLSQVMEAGTFYDYGRAGVTVALANSGERILSVQYFDGRTIRTHDSVRWSANALRPSDLEMAEPSIEVVEDVSLSVGRAFETVTGNDTPANWCMEFTEVAGPGTFFGSPGAGATCTP